MRLLRRQKNSQYGLLLEEAKREKEFSCKRPMAACEVKGKTFSQWSYKLQADLENIRKLLLQRNGAVVNVTADEKALTAVEGDLRGFLESLPETSAENADWSNSLPLLNEAITVPTQVCPKAVTRSALKIDLLNCPETSSIPEI